MLIMSSVAVHVLFVKLLVKLGTALLIGPAENCPISSPLRFLIQKLFWASGEDLKMASCVAPQTRYLYSIQIWRVIRCPLFLFKHLRTVFVECIVDRHVQCAQSPMLHLVESGWQQSVALFNELWEQKLINNFNYCLQQH